MSFWINLHLYFFSMAAACFLCNDKELSLSALLVEDLNQLISVFDTYQHNF